MDRVFGIFTSGFLCPSGYTKMRIQTTSRLSTSLQTNLFFTILDYHYRLPLNRSGQTNLRRDIGTQKVLLL